MIRWNSQFWSVPCVRQAPCTDSPSIETHGPPLQDEAAPSGSGRACRPSITPGQRRERPVEDRAQTAKRIAAFQRDPAPSERLVDAGETVAQPRPLPPSITRRRGSGSASRSARRIAPLREQLRLARLGVGEVAILHVAVAADELGDRGDLGGEIDVDAASSLASSSSIVALVVARSARARPAALVRCSRRCRARRRAGTSASRARASPHSIHGP